jgi:hypothetical protein
MKEINHLGSKTDGMLLKWILKKYSGRVWTQHMGKLPALDTMKFECYKV